MELFVWCFFLFKQMHELPNGFEKKKNTICILCSLQFHSSNIDLVKHISKVYVFPIEILTMKFPMKVTSVFRFVNRCQQHLKIKAKKHTLTHSSNYNNREKCKCKCKRKIQNRMENDSLVVSTARLSLKWRTGLAIRYLSIYLFASERERERARIHFGNYIETVRIRYVVFVFTLVCIHLVWNDIA